MTMNYTQRYEPFVIVFLLLLFADRHTFPSLKENSNEILKSEQAIKFSSKDNTVQ